ncbi:MAG: hypothetical protein RIS86_1969 [Planctomycetota bacterium]|jgi:predicted glycoside hydrolase/deacetylase ChbG (UPF0249 family)
MARVRLIINADDLGLHPAVRRAVEECAARGTVTSASVLANGPDLAAVRPVAGVSMGAHLNILRGAPLSPAREVRSLVGDDGRFVGSWSRLAWRAVRGALDLGEVRLEWSRQVARLRDHGLDPSHLDGEKHTQCLPGLLGIACEVASEHGIPFVRRSHERWGTPFPAGGATGFLRRAVLSTLCERAPRTNGARAADAVWGIAEQGRALRASRCARALREAAGVVEVVCHPGRVHEGDPGMPESFGRMRVARLWEPELRSLLEDPWLETARAEGWSLVGFDALVKDGHAAT